MRQQRLMQHEFGQVLKQSNDMLCQIPDLRFIDFLFVQVSVQPIVRESFSPHSVTGVEGMK